MSKMSKAERIRRAQIATELEAIEKRLFEVELTLAHISGSLSRVVCKLVDDGIGNDAN